MSTNQLVGGLLRFSVSGVQYLAKGSFTYNLGAWKREAVVGADGVHGWKKTPQVPFIEGEVTDTSDLDLATLLNMEDETVQLELQNGKVISLRNAVFAGDGNVGTEEGNIAVRFEGKSAQEIS